MTKDSKLQKIIISYVLPIFLCLAGIMFAPVADHYIKSYLNKDKRTLSKQIKANAKSTVVDSSQLNQFRFVTATKLNVRQEASRKSEILGYLRFGNPVYIKEKQKNWALVTWRDTEKGTQLTGWVFTRYLEKFQ